MKKTHANLLKVKFRLIKKAMNFLFLTTIFCGLAMQSMASSKEYADTEADSLVAHIEAAMYDEYILSTSGGNYIVKDIDLASDIVIKAKEGLAVKPMMTNAANTGTYQSFFDIQNGAFHIEIDGIDFDGTATEPLAGVVRMRKDSATAIIKNCEIKNFTTSSGIVRLDKTGTALTMDNCFVHDCYGRLIRLDKNDQVFGDISITNSTFANVTNDPVIHWISAASSTANKIVVDQCNFYNVKDHVFKMGSVVSSLAISNSIFDQIQDSIDYGTGTSTSTMDYAYLNMGGIVPTTITVTNTLGTAPVYTDGENLDFTLDNQASLMGSNRTTPIGDPRWHQEMVDENAMEYADTEVDSLVAHIEAAKYEVFILTTSGGNYVVKDIDLASDITIKSKTGLAVKPMMTNAANTGTYQSFFDIQNGAYHIEIDGIDFDGTATEPMAGVVRMRKDSATAVIKNSEIKNFTTSSGVARLDKTATALTMDNCFVHDCYGRLIRLDKNDQVFGDIVITNSTFANVTNDPVIHWISAASSTANKITIDQCNFFNVQDHVFKMGAVVETFNVSNTIFDQIKDSIDYGTPGTTDSINYSYVKGMGGTTPTGVVLSNELETAPVYVDSENLDLKLTNQDFLLGSDGDTPAGDPRWHDQGSAPVMVVYDEQSLTNAADQFVVAMSNKDAGFIYIILEGEAQSSLAELNAAVIAGKGAKEAVVAASTAVNVSTSGIDAGVYYAYAVDAADNISDKGINTITVLDANKPVTVMNNVQTVTNAKGAVAIVQSNKPSGTVYLVLEGEGQATIAELNAAVMANKADSATVTLNDIDISIPTDSLALGMYYAYAVDADANLSAKGDSAITIIKGAPEVYTSEQTVSDATDEVVAVQSSEEDGMVYIILDGYIPDSVDASVAAFEEAIAAGKGASGTVVAKLTDVNVSTTGLFVGIYYAYAVDAAGNISSKGTNKLAVVSSTSPFKEYTADESALLLDDINAGLYDMYILVTSAGVYDFTTPPDISKSITITAKPGLAQKPIIKHTAGTSGSFGMLRVRNATEDVDLVLEGIEFDCTDIPSNVLRSDSKINLVVRDCYVRNNSNSNGSFRLNKEGSTVVMENCLVTDSKQRVINLYSNTSDYGNISISNSTFVKLAGEGVVFYRSSGSYAGGDNLTIDHCTFSQIGGNIFRYHKDRIAGTVSVTNSLFDQVGDSLEVDVLDYNYLDVELLGADAGTNTFTTTPLFADSASYNFALSNASEYLCADGTTVGDLTWYMEKDSVLAIMYPQKVTNLESDVIKAQANVASGTLYLIREGELVTTVDELNAAVAASKGASGSLVAANTDVELSVTGLYSGYYFAYVLDNDGVISSASQYSSFVLDWLNIQYEAQTITNGVGKSVSVITSVDGVAYIVKEGDYLSIEDLESAVAGNRGNKADALMDVPVNISVEELQTGTYYGYAVSDTSISLRGENPIYINTAIFASTKKQTATNVEGNWSYAFVAGGSVGGHVYLLNDAVASENLTVEMLEEAVANNQAVKDTVSEAEVDFKVSTAGLEAGMYHFYMVVGTQVSAPASEDVTVRTPKVYYFSVEQAEDMRKEFYNATITTGDEVILTTSGGIYNFKTYFRIFGGVYLHAQKGLAEKPVLFYNPASGDEDVRFFMRLIEYYPPGGLLKIEGIELDGGANDGIAGDATFGLRVREDEDFNYGYSIVFEDCFMHDFNTENTNSSGVVSTDGYVFRQANNVFADSVVFNNCLVQNTYNPAVYFRSLKSADYFNTLKITNSTFVGSPSILQVSSPLANSSSNVYINQCTFDSIGVNNPSSRIIVPDNLGYLNMWNSIITNSTSQAASDTSLVLVGESVLMNCNFFQTSMVVSLENSQVSSTTTFDPEYYDREAFNYAPMNDAILKASIDQKQLGDLRWAANDDLQVEPNMLYVSDTELKLVFSQSIDTVSAKVLANYSLSGTVGISGNPEAITVTAPNAVVIAMADFGSAIDFATINVAVENVTNVMGNAIQASASSATYIIPIAIAIDEQLVANEKDQSVEATCGSAGSTVYLVPDWAIVFTVDDLITLVDSGYARKELVVEANVKVNIDVEGIEPGMYYGYAVNADETEWSARSENAATVKGLEVAMEIQMGKTNGPDEVIVAQSTYNNAVLYLVADSVEVASESDLLIAVANNDGTSADVMEAFADQDISIKGINPGRYRAYAVSEDSVSGKSNVPVLIDLHVGIASKLAGDVKIYAFENTAYIQVSELTNADARIYDVTGALVHSQQLTSTKTEILLPQGMFIIQVESENGFVMNKVIIK